MVVEVEKVEDDIEGYPTRVLKTWVGRKKRAGSVLGPRSAAAASIVVLRERA